MKSLLKRLVALSGLLAAVMLATATAASACGFLVSENGGVRLTRTTTLVAWEDGVERYITNFAFEGELESFGSLVPLPAAPTDVKKAGDWTLQRLVREVSPPSPEVLEDSTRADESEVDVLIETRIDSLDIVVLRGGSQDVLDWVNDNGFNLPAGPSTDHMLSYYGSRSPYWMATRFDAAAAIEAGFEAGDGIPVQVTIPTVRPWVPLHILHGSAADTAVIEADVFLLTPERPELLHGEGLFVNYSKPAGEPLLGDLRSDEGMEWIPDDAWFTHLELDTEAHNLTYDLSIGVGEVTPSRLDAGLDLDASMDAHIHGANPALVGTDGENTGGLTMSDVFAVSFLALLVGGVGVALIARQNRDR